MVKQMPIIERHVISKCMDCGKIIEDDTHEVSFEQYVKLSGDVDTKKACAGHNPDFAKEQKNKVEKEKPDVELDKSFT